MYCKVLYFAQKWQKLKKTEKTSHGKPTAKDKALKTK